MAPFEEILFLFYKDQFLTPEQYYHQPYIVQKH